MNYAFNLKINLISNQNGCVIFNKEKIKQFHKMEFCFKFLTKLWRNSVTK